MWLALLLAGCASTPTYIVEGQVVEVHEREVVIDHEAIEGFMGPMTMPFRVDDPTLLRDVRPGHVVIARIAVEGTEITLEKLRVTGSRPLDRGVDGPDELAVGAQLPATDLELDDGTTIRIGEGQQGPVLLTFVYTRCPDPTYCPATVARLGALQASAGDVTLVALTLDPERDTVEVLRQWRESLGAADWRGARADAELTRQLAMRAGLAISRAEHGEIVHRLRWLALGPDGRLLARHDGNDVPVDVMLAPFE